MPAVLPGDHAYHMLMKAFASEAEPPFESPEEQEYVWGRHWGCNTDVGQLRLVVMHRPGEEFRTVDTSKWDEELGAYCDRQAGWYWRGPGAPDIEKMQEQHDNLVRALEAEGARVEMLSQVPPEKFKTLATRDSIVAVPGGAIVCRLGARVRRGEEAAATRKVVELGMPILRTIHGTGIFEGGSFALIDHRTAVVGIGARCNEEGARQVEEVLRPMGIDLLRVYLAGYRQHIDGAFTMIDVDTALISSTLLPFCFLEELKARGIRTIDISPEDDAFTPNCLAVRPGRVVISETSDATLERLDKAGIDVVSIEYKNVYASGGGIHCTTAPLIRDAI